MPPASRPDKTRKPPPRRIKIVDEIIESMRQDIITGRLSHGERLPSERELSERFAVSQPTVREAIRALETLGLVEVFHGSGRFVRTQGDYALASALQTLIQLNNVDIAEVISLRCVLGIFSVRLAVANASDADIAAVGATYARLGDLDSIGNLDELVVLVIEFQRIISSAAHSSLLQSLESFLVVLLTEVQMKALSERDLGFWRSRVTEFQPCRRAIFEALKTRDMDKAVQAMENYFRTQRSFLEQDDTNRSLNVSNPKLIKIVSDMVRQLES